MTFLLFALVLIVFISVFIFVNKKKTQKVEILHVDELAPESTPEPTVVAEIVKAEIAKKKIVKKSIDKKPAAKKSVKKSTKK